MNNNLCNLSDGKKESSVREDLIKLLKDQGRSSSAASSFDVGEKVEARYRGKARYCPGCISRVNPSDGTYDIEYDDAWLHFCEMVKCSSSLESIYLEDNGLDSLTCDSLQPRRGMSYKLAFAVACNPNLKKC